MTIKQQGGVFGRHPEFSSVEVTGDLSISDKITHIGDENTSIRFPAADTMSVETAGLQRFVVMPNGNIGINNAAPYAFGATPEVVMTGGSATALSLNVGVSRAGFMYCDGSRTLLGEYRNLPMQFRTNNAERVVIEAGGDVTVKTGNIVIGTSGKGIDFSATSGTGSSELFDDYEEGTWTPTFSVEFTTAPAVTSAQYTKIGRQVTVTMLATDGVVTAGGSIGGLPFASNASQGAGAYGGNSDTTESLQGTVGQSASSISNIPARTLTGDTWQITATYFT